MKITLVWPPELVITESMFRHFSGLTEVAGYLKHNSKVIENSGLDVEIVDCSVNNVTSLNLANIAYNSRILAIYINMNNILEAYKLVLFLKSITKKTRIAVYGEAVSCNPQLFAKVKEIDYVIGNGQVEYALENIVIRELGQHLTAYYDLKDKDCEFTEKIININAFLPESKWGITDFEISPIDEYMKLSNGELHLLVNRGCPFFCKFCNERIVSSNKIHYRDIAQVTDFICADYDERIKSVYLDASTFTYNKEWVIQLCNDINKRKHHLEWKTCTRLDCIDEELVKIMAYGGCTRISIGVETFNKDIQEENKKEIEEERLIRFSNWCHNYGIKPRALLIMGLKGQKKDDVYKAKAFCNENKIESRFRVLQDYDVVINCDDINDIDYKYLDRWNTWNPFNDMDIEELRKYEYPPEKMGVGNYV